MLPATTPDTIAGAVNLNIKRAQIEAGFMAAEGVVFKAHLARKGANLRAMLREPHADFFIMRALMGRRRRGVGWTARRLAEHETANPLELDPRELRKVGAA